MKFFAAVFLIIAAAATFAQTTSAPMSKDEAAIRQADAEWMAAINAKSVERTTGVYDADAFTAGTAMPPARGRDAVRRMWADIFAQPGFSLTWKVDQVVVAESGATAATSGTWQMPDGAGPYLAVWRKQPNGRWKLLIDSAWHWRKSE